MANLSEIDIDALDTPMFLSESDRITTANAKKKLIFLKHIIEKFKDSIGFIPYVPSTWVDFVSMHVDELAKLYSQLKEVITREPTGQTTQHLQLWRTAIDMIDRYYMECIALDSNNKFLHAFSSVTSTRVEKPIESQAKFDALATELGEKHGVVDRLTKELNENIAKVVVKEYAAIFDTQKGKDKKAANVWLGISIGILTVVISLMLLSFSYDWFDTLQFDQISGDYKIIYPNLIAKLIVFSLGLYFVSFCFKQYSIYRNLEELNKHRRNALKSFSLFSDSIGQDDIASRNALMLQVAKAIYDQTPTGYLLPKHNDNNSPNFFDLSRVISSPKS